MVGVSSRSFIIVALFAILTSLVPPAQVQAEPKQLPHTSEPAQTIATVAPLPTTPTPAILPTSTTAHATIEHETALDWQNLPLAFVPNVGQTNQRVRFQVQSLGGQVFLGDKEITFALPSPITDTATLTPTIDTNRVRSHYALRMQFLGTAAQPEIAGVDRLPGTVNYVSGATAAQWHSNVATFAGVEYRNIYPGITLRFDGAQQRLKRTYVVAPGADPTAILWRYSGQATTTIDTAGQLLVTLPVRGMPKADSQPTLLEHAPVAWQTVAGVQRPVEVNYTLNKNDTIGFRVGAYDPALPLIIDPELLYSAIIGGANKDEANAVTVDATGSVYIVGETSSSSFPATTGTYSQSSDAFVMRLNPQGTAILYSTYLNGTASDEANAIAVDASG